MRTLLALGLLGLTIVLPLALAQDANDTPPAPGGHGGPCPTDVNCTGGTNPGAGGTCMDGQQGNESCDPHVYYLGGPSAGGSNTSTESSGASQPSKAVPALAVAGIVGTAVAATVLVSRTRKP
jgi:hypothetical protein